MTFSQRRRIGMVLIAITGLATICLVIIGIYSGHVHFGEIQRFQTGESQAIEVDISGYYFIPIILCGAFGAFCLGWPARKPPKLHE